MDKTRIKAGLIVFGIVVLIFLLMVLVVSLSNGKEDKDNFPDYDNLKIKQSDVEDKNSESYSQIKRRLESDKYFARAALISNYNYKSYTSADLQKMVWHYIFAFELKNKKYLSSIDYNQGLFCMRSRYIVDSFEELYGVKIAKDIDYLDGYYEYVKSKSNLYCFNFGNVARDYNNEIKIMVDGLSVKGGIVTSNLYLFEYYTNDTTKELDYVSELENSIKYSNYNNAQDIVKNKLNGKVSHKQIQFKIKNNGKFFKYQILYSKNLDY